jgi:predicted permease
MAGQHDVIGIWRRLTALVRRRRIDRDIDDELAFHLAMRRADLAHDGAADPDRAARRHFGNVALVRDRTRDMWTFPSFESVVQDARFAVRTLIKAPGFTLVAVFALAVGIGANTAIFSLVDSMLVRGLPYPESERLVVLIGDVRRQAVERRGGSYPDFLDWRAQAASYDGMAAYVGSTTTVGGGSGDPERIGIEAVSAPYFDVLGVSPVAGRVFRPDEDEAAGRDAVVVMGHDLWQRRFGGDPAVLGRTILLGANPYQIIGVMPAGFTGLTDQAELWMPFMMSGFTLDQRGSRYLQAVARLRPGASVEQATTEIDGIAARLEAAYPDTNDARGVEIAPLSTLTFGPLRPAVLALMAAVSFVLLIACANVANLLIGRSELRQKEIAVRSALGAGRGRLLRQLVTESCVLAGIGAALGVLLAKVALDLLVASTPLTLPTFVEPGLNLPVLAFTSAVALACGLLLGVAPALHSRTGRIGDVLKDSARGSSGAATHRLRGVLVVAEVSLAVVLLAGAGMMIQTVRNLAAIDPGYDVDDVLTLNVSVPRRAGDATASASNPAPPPFVTPPRDLVARLEALPGVTAASLSSDYPLSGNSSAVFYAAEGDDTTAAGTRPRAYVHRVTPGFFDTLGIPIVQGRTFLESELTADAASIVVSEGVVQRFWPGQNAAGKRVKLGSLAADTPWLSIVGVVPEVRFRGLPENPTGDPDLYFPYVDRGIQAVMVRTAVPPESVAASVRGEIRLASPDIVVYDVSTMATLAGAQTAQPRFTTWLMGVFAGVALLLSVVGIYGVMSYLVTQRSREFGIRLALGAGRMEIVRLVLGHGTRLIAVGLAIGAAAAFGLSRLLDALVFQVAVTDLSAAAAVALLAFVAVAACVIPALRATRVEPVVALRSE